MRLQTAYTYKAHLSCCKYREVEELDDSLCGILGCTLPRAHPGLCAPPTLLGRRPSRPPPRKEVQTTSDHPRVFTAEHALRLRERGGLTAAERADRLAKQVKEAQRQARKQVTKKRRAEAGHQRATDPIQAALQVTLPLSLTPPTPPHPRAVGCARAVSSGMPMSGCKGRV